LLIYGDQLLIAVQSSHVIRAVNLHTRIITRWAGTGTASSSGDGLDKLAATFYLPHGLTFLSDGSVLVNEHGGCRVTRVTPAGVMRRFMGTGSCSSTGDGGSALSATVQGTVGAAVDNSTGTTWVYVSDFSGNKVSAATAYPLSLSWSDCVVLPHVLARAGSRGTVGLFV